jgi:hypothetical protein
LVFRALTQPPWLAIIENRITPAATLPASHPWPYNPQVRPLKPRLICVRTRRQPQTAPARRHWLDRLRSHRRGFLRGRLGDRASALSAHRRAPQRLHGGYYRDRSCRRRLSSGIQACPVSAIHASIVSRLIGTVSGLQQLSSSVVGSASSSCSGSGRTTGGRSA